MAHFDGRLWLLEPHVWRHVWHKANSTRDVCSSFYYLFCFRLILLMLKYGLF